MSPRGPRIIRVEVCVLQVWIFLLNLAWSRDSSTSLVAWERSLCIVVFDQIGWCVPKRIERRLLYFAVVASFHYVVADAMLGSVTVMVSALVSCARIAVQKRLLTTVHIRAQNVLGVMHATCSLIATRNRWSQRCYICWARSSIDRSNWCMPLTINNQSLKWFGAVGILVVWSWGSFIQSLTVDLSCLFNSFVHSWIIGCTSWILVICW